MLKFVNINLMISGSGSGWILLNSPIKGWKSRVGAVPLLWKLVTGWNIGQQLPLSSISMCRGMEFQSILGINEYFRQFLFVAIWINWLCVDERRTGRRIICVGMARRPHRAWCKMETLLTFLLSSNDSQSSSCFHFWRCSHVYSCLLRNEHPCVNMIVPTLNINT